MEVNEMFNGVQKETIPSYSRGYYQDTKQAIRKGDVILVHAPERQSGSEMMNHPGKRTRPAVIIQNETGNMFSPTIIVAYLTGHRSKLLPTHVVLNNPDYSTRMGSVILTEQLDTLQKERILKHLYRLSKEDMLRVDEALKLSLGINI